MNCLEFAARREELMSLMGKNSIAILPTAPELVRNRDVHFPYRPDSSFQYLTGFAEPEAVLVLIPEREQGQFLLFCRERDKEKETWNGRRAGLEGARRLYGADDAFPITDIDDIVPNLIEKADRLYYPMGCYPEFDTKITAWLNQLRLAARRGVGVPNEIVTLDHVIDEMRLFKREAEIAIMRQAANISVQAHHRAMQVCRAGMYEYQVEAEINHEFMRLGSRASAYPAIVAGGDNACILHYTENSDVLKDGDLLLIDAGAEFEYYASDITRTFPVNGRFSEAQKQVYNIVLKAQLAAIEKVQPNNHWNEPHDAAVRVLTEGMLELGLLEGDLEQLIQNESYKKFYMHRTGHWLGMDVHDVGSYKLENEWRAFEAGMVTTIEPGLYIPVGTTGINKAYWGIGIRIEDDVLLTENGHEVLTAACIKQVDEIENWMALRREEKE